MIQFVDYGTDERVINSLPFPSEILEKALDKTKLVQKEVQYKTKSGSIASRKQWVKAGEEISQPKARSSEDTNSDKSSGEESSGKPTHSYTLTENTKHMVPVGSVQEIPGYITSKLGRKIPPAWTEIMVSSDPEATLLVMGKDSKGRVQRVYDPEKQKANSESKFQRVSQLSSRRQVLGEALNKLEDRDTADCISLIIATGLRPGSNRDTKAKKQAYGATTLKGEHVVEENGEVYLRFTGKEGVEQDHLIEDPGIAEMLLNRKKKNGKDAPLFHTSDAKLRAVMKAIDPEAGFHTKDLRTLKACDIATSILKNIPPTENPKEFRKVQLVVATQVSRQLGNTRTEALRSYIDPRIFKNWSPIGFENYKKDKYGKEG